MPRIKLALLVLILTLPALTLLPLGTLWLWQQKLLLTWALSALAFTAASFVFVSAVLGRVTVPTTGIPDTSEVGGNSTEAAAWSAVRQYAATVDPSTIHSRNELLDVATRTVEKVAHAFHPADTTPVWNFTLPELLLLIEQVSRRLRPVFIDNVPLAEQLSVGQMLRLYEWRSMVDLAGNAYEAWRLLRVVNPLSAVTHEARERITKQIVSSLRNDMTRRLIDVVVHEIASAAIDLYSGRLRATPDDLAPAHTLTTVPGGAARGPVASRIPRSILARTGSEIGKAARGARAFFRHRPLQK